MTGKDVNASDRILMIPRPTAHVGKIDTFSCIVAETRYNCVANHAS